MAEETGQTETSTETETTSAPLVNADGELREGWRDTLPEDIRGEKVFDRVSNFEGVMKSLASAEKMIGRDKVPIPTEASTDVEWDAFYVAGGRPETAADYNFTRPEELPEEQPEEHYNQELATAAQELFHKIGLSKKQANALFAFNNNNAIAQLAKNAQDDKFAMEELKNGLYKDWGNAYEQKKNFGNVAIEEGVRGDEEFKIRLTQKFGNDPDFIRFAANLGSKFSETGSPPAAMIPTPGDIQDQINAIEQSPAYKSKDKKIRFAAAEKAMRLREQRDKSMTTGFRRAGK